MNGVVIGDREIGRRAETLDVPTMRADLARILGDRLVRELVRPDGETVESSAELLASTEEIRTEAGAKELRAVYHLAYREVKFSEEGVLKAEYPARAKFEALVVNLLEDTRTRLLDAQPNCDWQLVGALVDAVPMDAVAQQQTGKSNAPGSIDPSLAMHQAMMRGERTDDPEGAIRLGGRVHRVEQAKHWRWYIRMVWADVSGAGEWVDPIEVRGGKPGPHSKYAQTRIVRLLPPGGRKNREEAVKLLRRVGAVSVVAPAPEITDEQRDGALVMLSGGMNPALVARALGVPVQQVEALAAAGDKPKRTRRKVEGEEAQP